MSEDTKFPELEEDVWGFVNMWKIDEWFERCMDDVPVISLREPNYEKQCHAMQLWYEKWFSQFETSQREDVVLSSQLGFRVEVDDES